MPAWIAVYLYMLLFSFLVSAALVKLSIKLAYKFDIVDRPSNRKVHLKETPRFGGFGIVFGFILTIILNYLLIIAVYKSGVYKSLPMFSELYKYIPGAFKVWRVTLGILSCGFAVFLLGVYDDKYCLPAKTKLVIQMAVALFVIYFFNIKITLFIHNNAVQYIITLLWIVGITNAFNLLDNMDGLSAGVAVVSSIVYFISAFNSGHYFIGLFLIAFIGVLLGFLKYNFPPAKTFMGDAGSLFIGFNLAVFTIMGTYYIKGSAHLYPTFMPLLILAVPIYDTISVIVIRIKNKESIFKPDKNHFSHRISRLGMTHKGVALFIYLVAFCVGLSSILLPKLDEFGIIIVVIQALCMISIIILLEYYGKINK